MQDLTINDLLTLAAIVFGPLLGAWFALWLQGRREKRDRRFDIFRTLMRTRRTPIWPDHVGALNLVEIEFSDNPEVIRAWKALFEHFGQPQPRHPDEELPDGLGEAEYLEREKRYNVRIGQERHSLLSKLLHAIGKDLGFNIEQLEIFEGGYTPQGVGHSRGRADGGAQAVHRYRARPAHVPHWRLSLPRFKRGARSG